MSSTSPGDDRRGDERRSADRRRNERRQVPRQPSFDESWLGAAGVGGDTQGQDSRRPEPSIFGNPWQAADEAPDSRQMSREARRVATSPGGALPRIVRTYAAARAAMGVALVAAQGATTLLGVRTQPAIVLVCLLYALQAVVLWLLPSYRRLIEPQVQLKRRRVQWLATIGVDLLAFGLMHVLDAGSSFNYAALLVLPVLMSGVLMSRLMALATSAAVASLLLVVTWRALPGTTGEGAALLAQSGLAGIGLFAMALVAGELAMRLAREELAARGSLEIARQQARLNRLVIEEMADGVLVVDRRLRVRAANPAARTLLAPTDMAPAAPFQLRDRPEWAPLGEAVERALADRDWPDAGRDVVLGFAQGSSRSLRMRVRFTRRSVAGDEGGQAADEDFCVVLLEDVRTAQARVRQEKLAAMGRISAGIAHEIRNPLAAIAQANALMMEDELTDSQARLSRMVADNVRRLQRIVDDVLEVAPGPRLEPGVLDARHEVQSCVTEWARTNGIELEPQSRVRLDLPTTPLGVIFDAEHLRRVLINLLDNGLRHGSDRPDAVMLRLAARDEATAVLSVASDGAPIAADVERHLFEPFFSTRSRGSGLGLYICRELCERYGATIEYRPRAATDRHRNGFVVVMQRGALAPDPRNSAT
jgi:two-component system sensor histidine kinase PilS (NtrC family)